MEAKIAEIQRLFQKFKVAYNKNDVDTSDNILSQMKVLLLLLRCFDASSRFFAPICHN